MAVIFSKEQQTQAQMDELDILNEATRHIPDRLLLKYGKIAMLEINEADTQFLSGELAPETTLRSNFSFKHQ